jgi:predicted transposase YdaD
MSMFQKDGRKEGKEEGRKEGRTDDSVTISLRNFVGEVIKRTYSLVN